MGRIAALRASDLSEPQALQRGRPNLALIPGIRDATGSNLGDLLRSARDRGDTKELFERVRSDQSAARWIVHAENNHLFIKATHGISIVEVAKQFGTQDMEVLLKSIQANRVSVNWPLANEIAMYNERGFKEMLESPIGKGTVGANATVWLEGARYFRIAAADVGYHMQPHLRPLITDEHFGYGRREPNVIPQEIL